ncbi:MAG: hypothetical protein AABX29_07460 [Nanoarchaeota archaeon]
MKTTIILGILISIFLISGAGCQVDDKLAKEIASENIDKLIVCNEPYIRYGTECCLDQNKNKVCDNDEGQSTQQKSEQTNNQIVGRDSFIDEVCNDLNNNQKCEETELKGFNCNDIVIKNKAGEIVTTKNHCNYNNENYDEEKINVLFDSGGTIKYSYNGKEYLIIPSSISGLDVSLEPMIYGDRGFTTLNIYPSDYKPDMSHPLSFDKNVTSIALSNIQEKQNAFPNKINIDLNKDGKEDIEISAQWFYKSSYFSKVRGNYFNAVGISIDKLNK